MIQLCIYFTIYLIIVLIPYFFLSDLAMYLFGIALPQPSMGFLFLSFLFFPVILKLLKISFKILSVACALIVGLFVAILTSPLKSIEDSREEKEAVNEIAIPMENDTSLAE